MSLRIRGSLPCLTQASGCISSFRAVEPGPDAISLHETADTLQEAGGSCEDNDDVAAAGVRAAPPSHALAPLEAADEGVSFLSWLQNFAHSTTNFSTVEVLGHNLLSHGAWTVQATGLRFQLGEDFSLGDLMQLGLHQYVDACSEVVDRAAKELTIENSLKRIEDTWATLTLSFMPYQACSLAPDLPARHLESPMYVKDRCNQKASRHCLS